MSKRVLIFGTFDGFDAGHQFVVNQASKLGDELFVAVARDEHVRLLKKKEPRNSEQARLQTVSQDPLVTKALLSDEMLGSYHIIDEVKPDLVAFGFDQNALKDDLIRWMHEHQYQINTETIDYFPE